MGSGVQTRKYRMIEKNTFTELVALMRPYGDQLIVTTDTDRDYYVNTPFIMNNKKPLFFGAVNVKKNYVSYHLMPVYVEPALLEDMSDALGKRMQGKSCFNFKRVDGALFDELRTLTGRGFDSYRRAGYLEATS